ncbi:hypothetical protein Tdes44962_MAKER09130 [Teratosphaeria destructans]|uniref:Uncharacterized protein n=1 Tax=Teratosphaeria destructans TaxID=418781 RepID=A0A9W7STY3_9PEZI|nr:hypothetical protein Tdes44962_MAKER09130 [Teratosphaeria destructans]
MWLVLLTQFVVAVLELLFLAYDDYDIEFDFEQYRLIRSYTRYVTAMVVGSVLAALTMTTGAWTIAIVGEARGSRRWCGITFGRRFLDVFLWVEFALFAGLLVLWFFLWIHHYIVPIFWVLSWLLMIGVACNVPKQAQNAVGSYA